MRSDRHINPVALRLTTLRIVILPGRDQLLAIRAQTRRLARPNNMFASSVRKLGQCEAHVEQMRAGHHGYAAQGTSITQQPSERKMRVREVLGVLVPRVPARTTAVGDLGVTAVPRAHLPADGDSDSTAGLNGGRGAAMLLAAPRVDPLLPG